MEKKKRIGYIDLAKGLGILLVTWGHITKLSNPVDTWGSAFKLSIFFITAGYVVCYTNSYERMNFKIYALKLVKSLGVPYVMFSFLSIGFRLASMVLKHRVDMATIKSYIFATGTLRGVFALWFLPALFIGELIFFVIMKYLPKWTRVLMLVLPVIVIVKMSQMVPELEAKLPALTFERLTFVMFPLGKAMIALWFLYIGYLGCKVLQRMTNRYMGLFLGLVMTGTNFVTSQMNLGVDINLLSIGESPILFFVNGVIGAFGALLLFQFFEQYWRFPVLNYIGKNSLVLMMTQRPFYIISMATAGWTIFSGMPGVLATRYYIDCTGILLITLIVEYPVITWLNEKGKVLLGRF